MSEAIAETSYGEETDPQVKAWERFLKTYYKARINEAVLAYPVKRSVEVSYWDLDKHDPDLAADLLTHPVQALRKAKLAVQTIDLPELMGPRPEMHVRITHLPEPVQVDVRDLRSGHVGKIVAVTGLVKKVTEVRPKVKDALYRSTRPGCDALIREPQDDHLNLKEPVECYEDEGGCGRQHSFRLVTEPVRGQMSTFVDMQKIEIQETPEKLRGGEQPQRISIFTEDDLCATVTPGDRLTVNGILRTSIRKHQGQKSTILDIHLEAVSFEMESKEFEEVEITPEEEEEIKRFSRDPEVYEKMTASIAPSIYGMNVEKEALLMQLFGGLEKHLPDGTRLRGDLHILLVGDPGVAKSQLIRYMSRISPRGIYTSGKSSSGAGLTAAAVKDEFGDGRWTLEAGAMVLADRGLLCVDEIDKMSKEDQSSMHEGMEQQSISVAKAGITASLQSRCSVLGAANPKFGRFEEFTPLPDQIEFPPALLSRFDVIFVLLDKPEQRRDAMLAKHILGVHRGGGMHMQVQGRGADTRWTAEDVEESLRKVDPEVDSNFLRKYVAYAKRSCFPVLTDDAKERLSEYYVNLRRQAQGDDGSGGPVPLTARQLEALVRLSEASARVRISDEVTVEDTDRAIRIVETYMKRLSNSEGGIMDADIVSTGVSHSQRSAITVIRDIVRDLAAGTEYGAAREEVVEEAVNRGVEKDRAEATLDRLKRQGDLMSPRDGFYRVVRER